MNTRTEADLVEGARNGSVEAFGELYCRYYAAAEGMAYCVVADCHLAEDAAQEAFVVASRELAGLRRPDRFGPWICTIAKRLAGRLVRSHRQLRVLQETAVPPMTDSASHINDLVRQAVRDLPDKAREVITLHYFANLSHKGIAASLGLSLEAVHGRLVRARRMLAKRLLDNGIGDLEL
jgi:RNA polymerase sigma-70 factor (ECF subfamily)